MTVLGQRPVVLLGQSNQNHWLTIALQGTRSNRNGLGFQIEVNGQWQTVTAAGSYVAASDKRTHFGLGASTRAALNIHWTRDDSRRSARSQPTRS